MVSPLDSPELRKLPRAELQSLAKREVVRAVGKSEDIIRRLINKHPRGVPAPETSDTSSASLGLPQRYFLKNVRKDTPLNSPVPETSEARTDAKGKGRAIDVSDVASPSPTTEGLELRYPEDNDVPPPEAPNRGRRVEQEELDETCNYVKGAPSHYMVVDALRQFTSVANAIPSMETHIAEIRCLLQRAETLLEKATPAARELAVTREYLETILLARMKQKRELWDGTGRMEKMARRTRMQQLRTDRRLEALLKWEEFNKKNDQEQEPLSTFLLESDEEVIDSLETTPTSSRGGSAKRAREESGTGESQKKRACA